MEQEIIVRTGELKDIEQLVSLNKKWVKTALENNLQNGFLTSLYTEQEFEKIIREKEIVVALQEDNIIGWYLINNQINNEVQSKNLIAVEKLKQDAIVFKNAKVALGAQALVIKEFQVKGIRERLLGLLVDNLKLKYDYMFSSIQKLNPRANTAHLRDDWQLVDEDENRVYVIYKLN